MFVHSFLCYQLVNKYIGTFSISRCNSEIFVFMDCVVSGVSNNEMGMECCTPQFIVQIISGDILCKLHKDVITLVNGT